MQCKTTCHINVHQPVPPQHTILYHWATVIKTSNARSRRATGAQQGTIRAIRGQRDRDEQWEGSRAWDERVSSPRYVFFIRFLKKFIVLMSNYLPHTIVPLQPRMGPETRLGSMFFSSSIATSCVSSPRYIFFMCLRLTFFLCTFSSLNSYAFNVDLPSISSCPPILWFRPLVFFFPFMFYYY